MMALGAAIAALGVVSLVVTLGLSTLASAGFISAGAVLTGTGAALWKKSNKLSDTMEKVAEAKKKIP